LISPDPAISALSRLTSTWPSRSAPEPAIPASKLSPAILSTAMLPDPAICAAVSRGTVMASLTGWMLPDQPTFIPERFFGWIRSVPFTTSTTIRSIACSPPLARTDGALPVVTVTS
jgi:hypothetical protein